MYLPGSVNLVVEYRRKLHAQQIFSHNFTFLSEKNINLTSIYNVFNVIKYPMYKCLGI